MKYLTFLFVCFFVFPPNLLGTTFAGRQGIFLCAVCLFSGLSQGFGWSFQVDLKGSPLWFPPFWDFISHTLYTLGLKLYLSLSQDSKSGFLLEF